MGSLSFAVGGGLAGAGQGLANIGAEAMAQQRMEALERLRADYETQRQQAGFTEQEKLQGKTQEFEKGQTEVRLKAASAAAGATREFEKGENVANRASREKIGAGHDVAREDTAAINAYSRSSGKTGGVKPFQFQKLSNAPMGPDGKPIPGALPEQKAVLFDPNRNIAYIQHGDRLYRADERGNAVIDPKTTNRMPASNTEMQALQANPYATVPQGYKNAGMTYMDAFEAEHGYIPAQVQSTVNQLSQHQQQSSSQGIKLPSGRVFNPPQGGGGGGETAPEAPDAQEVQEESGSDQPFQSNAMGNYSANAQ